MTQIERYRVIQWASGNVGSRALRTVIEHPQLELVGLWVSYEAKIGLDAGKIEGITPTGIKATSCAADLIALDADCVLYIGHWLPISSRLSVLYPQVFLGGAL